VIYTSVNGGADNQWQALYHWLITLYCQDRKCSFAQAFLFIYLFNFLSQTFSPRFDLKNLMGHANLYFPIFPLFSRVKNVFELFCVINHSVNFCNSELILMTFSDYLEINKKGRKDEHMYHRFLLYRAVNNTPYTPV